MKNPWKKLNTKIIHKNPWWHIRHDSVIRPDGKKGDYYVVSSPPSVFVVAMDEQKKIMLIKQFRYPTQMWSWEVVAGGCDKQNPLAAAKRELWEETGLNAKIWKRIGLIQVWNGVADELSYIFLATKLTSAGKNKMVEEAISEAKAFTLKEIVSMIQKGRITDSQSISSIMQALIHLKQI